MKTIFSTVTATAALAASLSCAPLQAQTTSTITRTVSHSYDAYGTLIQQVVEPSTPSLRVTVDLTPNAHGLITSKVTSWTDPITGTAQTRTEGTGYDTRSRFALTSTNAKNHTETRTFDDGTGAMLTLTDANSLVTGWQYDEWGRKARETRPDGTATSWDYVSCVNACAYGAVMVTIVRQWSGASQTQMPLEQFTDSLGRPVRTRTWGFDGVAIYTDRDYDALGRLKRVARPRFTGVSAAWTMYNVRDDIGRLLELREPNADNSGYDTASFAYDGPTLTITNAKGQTRTERRNALGKLDSVTDAKGFATSYAYDGFGNLVQLTDPKGNRTVVVYDRLGRKTTLADPNLGTLTYVVDPLGQTRRQTDASGQATTFDFDALGRMTRRLEPDLDSRWDYDSATKGVGRLAEAYTMVAGVKDFRRIHRYDSLGRPSSETTSLDWDYRVQHTYDAFGRPDRDCHHRMARGGGTTAGHCDYRVYNAQGYLAQFQRDVAGTSSLVWAGLVRDAEGRFTSEQLGNGVVLRRGYNPYKGQLERIQAGPSDTSDTLQSDTYAYDPLGNLHSRTQRISTGGATFTETFGYDELNRLLTSTIGATVKSSTYDELGNLTSRSGVGSYNYPASGGASVRPHAVSSITGSVAGLTNPGFSYDASGNLLSGLGRAYEWTSFDMPESIDRLSGGAPVERTGFVYGAGHERVRQTIRPMTGGVPGNATTTIWYGGSIEKEVKTAANTTTLRTQLPMGLGFVEEVLTGTNVAASSAGTRNPHYFLKDHLGSTVAITDQAQAVLQRLSYDAWGRRRNPNGSDDAGAGWGSLKNNEDHSGYTGHEHLDQLALVHMNARLYDPFVGRHVSADPTVPDPADTQSLNRYSYVLNNALAFTDPTGLQPATMEYLKDEIERAKTEAAVTLPRVEITGNKLQATPEAAAVAFTSGGGRGLRLPSGKPNATPRLGGGASGSQVAGRGVQLVGGFSGTACCSLWDGPVSDYGGFALPTNGMAFSVNVTLDLQSATIAVSYAGYGLSGRGVFAGLGYSAGGGVDTTPTDGHAKFVTYEAGGGTGKAGGVVIQGSASGASITKSMGRFGGGLGAYSAFGAGTQTTLTFSLRELLGR